MKAAAGCSRPTPHCMQTAAHGGQGNCQSVANRHTIATALLVPSRDLFGSAGAARRTAIHIEVCRFPPWATGLPRAIRQRDSARNGLVLPRLAREYALSCDQ